MTDGVAAILLAAGKSRRMGSCKQLLPLGGSTVIAHCLEAVVMGGIGEIVVVISKEENGVAEAAQGFPVRVVVNQDSGGDMASSVRAGRNALIAEVSGVIVALCDCPLVSATTIASLVTEHTNSPDRIIIPCHQGHNGHPLLFPRTILDELTEGRILRDLVHRDPKRNHSLNVNDPGVLIDMDTPEDYHRIYDMMKPC